MSEIINGKRVYNWEDVDTGRCTPADIWTAVPPEPEPSADMFPTEEELSTYSSDPESVRRHIDERLHDTMEALSKSAARGDVQSARALVSVAERRAKMLGLDAPKEVSVELHRKDWSNLKTLSARDLEKIVSGEVILPEA